MREQGDWVIVRRYVDSSSAEMAADFLRKNGIDAILQGQHAAEVLTKAYPVEVDVLVSESRLDDAKEALEALDHGTPVDDLPGGDDPNE